MNADTSAKSKQKNKKSPKRKVDTTVIVAIIGLVGTIAAALCASPVLIALIQKTPIQTPLDQFFDTSPEPSPPLRLETSFPSGSPCFESIILPDYLNPLANPKPTIVPYSVIGESRYYSENLINHTVRELTVTSLASKEWVRLPNWVIAKVVNYQPLPGPLDTTGWPCGGRGGFLHIPDFRINHSKASGEFYGYVRPLDFIKLQPGELEIFKLEIAADEPGLYEVMLGIEYHYRGATSRMWASPTVFVRAPDVIRAWNYEGTSFTLQGTYKFGKRGYVPVSSP